ncbi:MAG: creatininase family protein [Anaerolineaceae bacterium]|nr:creatininase family protein [Anaerolineaceae bacterium]
MSQNVLLEKMTWPETQAALKNGFDTVILMTGSIEQHGPHLPLGTDTFLGYQLAQEMAQLMGHTLVAPVLRPGLSEHHMAFKGTITISKDTFNALVCDYVDSLVRHGFKRIILSYSHGGNAQTLGALAPKLAAKYPHIKFLLNNDMQADYETGVLPIAEKDGIDDGVRGVHAGEFETSVMLAYDESLVRTDKLAVGFTGDLSSDKESLNKLLKDGLHSVTDNGILGDARPANKERGELYMKATAQSLINSLMEVKAE